MGLCETLFTSMKDHFAVPDQKEDMSFSWTAKATPMRGGENARIDIIFFYGKAREIIEKAIKANQTMLRRGYVDKVKVSLSISPSGHRENYVRHICVSYGQNISNDEDYFVIQCGVMQSECTLEIHRENGSKNLRQGEVEINVEVHKNYDAFIVHDNKTVIRRMVNSGKIKSFPANLKQVAERLPDEVFDVFIANLMSDSGFVKDLLAEKTYPPIAFERIKEFHNKKEFVEYVFRNDGLKLPSTANTHTLKQLYAAGCATKYIINGQEQILLNETNGWEMRYHTMSMRDRKEIASAYILTCLSRRNPTLDHNIIQDFIRLAIEYRVPIDLTVGKKRIIRIHDQLAEKASLRALRGQKLVIPNTPLKYLQLSKEFTLLRTVNALVEEGDRNHNCVASYAEYIRRGYCVIYSADVFDEHLTIEIQYKQYKGDGAGTFVVAQCLKACNRACSPKVKKYVEAAVKAASADAIEKYKASLKKKSKKKGRAA